MTAKDYATDVLSGKILACKWVKLACQRFINDLKNQKKLGIHFDDDEVARVLKFFSVVKHTVGEWAGQPFDLSGWQVFIIANIFGWKKEDGTRRFRTVYLETARKSGKTTLLAAIGLYLLTFDKEEAAQIYTVATKLDQARISHSEATRMVSRCSSLSSRISVFKNNLNVPKTHSKFEPLGSDSKTLDGLNTHAALADELHAWPNRDLWDVIFTSTGARRQPLVVAITTAGFDKHSICWEQHEYTERILDNILTDDTFFGIIFTLDEEDLIEDNWKNEKIWIKANPNLGICTKLDDLKMKAKRAAEVPTSLNAFKRLHLNIWTESVTRWITSDKWNLCGTEELDEKTLHGRPCYAGLDLSTTTDVSALVLVFPPQTPDETYKILSRFWIPKDNMHERVNRDRVPYDVWSREGYIKATQGNVIDYAFILNELGECMKNFDLKELAFDRWGSTKIIQDLQDMGFQDAKKKHYQRYLIDFGQGFASMAAPTKELEKMVLGKEIEHYNNPVLAWMMSNTVVKQDPAGNMKPDKGESTERIDGIVALVMAISRAVQDEGESIYEERGILTL